MKKFKQFLSEEVLVAEEILEFSNYIDFLFETVSLPQVKPETVSWGRIKQGFDETKDPVKSQSLAKAGKKRRGNRKLLGQEGSNPKIAKEAEAVPEFITKGLSLSPSDESGRINTCSCATEECRAACLNKAGRGAMSSVQTGRLDRTNMMIDHPGEFMGMVKSEIQGHSRKAKKIGKRAAVRLNVVSDIPYEKLAPEIFHENPDVQFYDYTKIGGRVMNPDGTPKKLPPNYHLTLSSTGIQGKEHNWGEARQHLSNGGIVAMVFGVQAGRGKKPGGALPTHITDEETGQRWRIIDGDIHDHRHLDKVYNKAKAEEGLVAGLRIKGGKRMLAKAGDFAVRVPEGATEVIVPRGTTRKR